MASLPYMANSVGPSWLPASVAESRKLAYWAQILAGVIGVVLLILGILNLLIGDQGYGIGTLIVAIIALVLAYLLKGMLFDIIDQGKFKEASERLLLLGILGLFAGVLPGILLLLGYVRIQEVFQPQYQQYHPQNASVAPPQQSQQQPAQAEQSAPRPAQQQDQMQTLREGIKEDQAATEQKKKEQKTEMIKCNKCGVQFPSFMHACPNCNEPKSK